MRQNWDNFAIKLKIKFRNQAYQIELCNPISKISTFSPASPFHVLVTKKTSVMHDIAWKIPKMKFFVKRIFTLPDSDSCFDAQPYDVFRRIGCRPPTDMVLTAAGLKRMASSNLC